MKNEIKQAVRNLRYKQTKAEKIFWQEVRNHQLGVKFLRQHPLFFEWEGKRRFVVTDFYCRECNLVVEIDGGIHESQKDYDNLRSYVLNELGFRVVRFNNDEVADDIERVLGRLRRYIK